MKISKKIATVVLFIGIILISIGFVSCAIAFDPFNEKQIDSISDSIPLGYGKISIEIPQTRGWTIALYNVTATKSGETPVQTSTTGNSVSMLLKIGQWDINVEGQDSDDNIIYQGVAKANVTENGTNVTVGLLKKAGNLKLDISQLSGYSVTEGDPGYIEKIVVTASKSGFSDVTKEINSFSNSVYFTDMVAGDWNISIIGQARDVNPIDYSPLSTYTTYVSTTFTQSVTQSILTSNAVTFTTQNVVTPVKFGYNSGSYSSSIDVTLTCDTIGATIFYSTDGTTPSLVYSSPITINEGDNLTIKAMATKSGLTTSIIGERTYSVNSSVTSTPSFSHSSGTYSSDISVEITSSDGGAIYYTLDGSEPNETSSVYSSAINVAGDGTTLTIKAVAKASDKSLSSVASATYSIAYPKVAAPVISPASGTYNSDQLFSINCGTPNATIYYTLDGSIPTTSSLIYSNPFTLSNGQNIYIKAKAICTGYSDSNVVTQVYTITSGSENTIIFTQADIIVIGDDWQTFSLLASSLNWFGFEVSEEAEYKIEWQPQFEGVVTVFENDLETTVALTGSSTERFCNLTSGRYFMSINSVYDVSSINIRIMNNGTPVTTTTTTTSTTTSTSSTTTTTTTTVATGLILHAKNYTHIHYWETIPDALSTTWPGEAMTSEGGGWYTYTIMGQTSANIVFNNNGSGQTADLSRTGEGWYDGTWHDSNPDVTAPVVTATPDSGEFTDSVTVSLSVNPVVSIYYTTDGSTPDINSNVWNGDMTFTDTTTLKTFVTDNGVSEVKTFTYTKSGPTAPIVTATPGSMTFADSVTVSLSVDPVVPIYYTTDGSIPDAASSVWSGDMTFTDTTILKTFVTDNGVSEVKTFTYTKGTIDPTKPYFVNPGYGLGVSNGAITIDGNSDDWNDSMIIALDMANDDPRSLGDNWTMHEPPFDLTHLWAAWDDNNLYLAWQFVDITDAIDPTNAGSGDALSGNDGILQWIALDTKPGEGASLDMWGKNNGDPYWTGSDLPDVQIYLSSSLWQGYVSRAVNGTFPVDDGGVNYFSIADANIDVSVSASLAPSDIWGPCDADDRMDSSKIISFINEGKNGDVHTATNRDSFYEMKIPLSFLGINRTDLETNGIGVMIGGPMDTIPNDPATLDTPGVETYNSSFEWSDSDSLTSNFARIGN